MPYDDARRSVIHRTSHHVCCLTFVHLLLRGRRLPLCSCVLCVYVCCVWESRSGRVLHRLAAGELHHLLVPIPPFRFSSPFLLSPLLFVCSVLTRPSSYVILLPIDNQIIERASTGDNRVTDFRPCITASLISHCRFYFSFSPSLLPSFRPPARRACFIIKGMYRCQFLASL